MLRSLVSLLVFLWHLKRGEEDIPLFGARRYEFAQQKEKGAKGNGLDEVKPRVDVHKGCRRPYRGEGQD